MNAEYADVILTPRAQLMPIALVAQSASILVQNADSLRKTIDEFVLSNPMVEQANPDTDDEMDSLLDRCRGRGETLAEQLYTQLRINEQDTAVLYAGWFIINSLDRDGYLRENEQELIRTIGCNYILYQKALRAVQALEPAGIAGRNLSECLSIQLRRLENRNPLAEMIADRYLEKLATHTLTIEGCTAEQIAKASELIRSLDPRPGLAFDETPPLYISPDVCVSILDDGHIEVRLVNQPLSPILSDQYASYIKSGNDMERQYIQDNLMYARSFLYALEQRGKTLLRIVAYAADTQKEYLRHMDLHQLKPLNFSRTADALGISVPTVSRAVQNKYMEYAGRLFPIKNLFSKGGCSNASREAITARIEQLCLDGENMLTDKAIAEALCEEGIMISRRTVNKYRNFYLAKQADGYSK